MNDLNDLITICVWPDGSWCFDFDIDNAFGYAKSDDYHRYDIPAHLDESQIQDFVNAQMAGYAS